MPTSTGAETISERLTRLRAELVRVRQTIANAENNGQDTSLGATRITQIAYERAQEREIKLHERIRNLEARLAGSLARSGIAITQTRMPS